MKTEPIDYNNPLGISKREWTKVLGANLALLLLVYAIALICTLCGNDLFLLRFYNERLNEIEKFLMERDLFWVFQIPVAAIEATIICSYSLNKKPRLLFFFAYCSVYYAICTVIYFTTKVVPSFMTIALCFALSLSFGLYYSIKSRNLKYGLICLARYAIAMAISLILNEGIGYFRTLCIGLWKLDYSNSFYIALTIEYDIALAMALGLLTLIIPWEKGGKATWKSPAASGSSKTSKNNSPKPTANNLNPKLRKRIFFIKAKAIVIQTVALVVVAFLPIISGRGIEFSLVYVSFYIVRMILGFNRSFHFKSELSCITIGALTFWGLTFLAPSAEASIVISLLYGSGLALGFRLYWELHDLMMYRRAAKTDRYAMLYTAFKGNLDSRRIRGVMRMKGLADEREIKMVQMYMAKEKVDYIAQWMNAPLRTIDRRLTEIAEELYGKR